MNLVGLALAAALLVVVGRWLYRILLSRTPKARERAELRALMLLCHGDDRLAQRLISSELERKPGLNYEQAARMCRRRLERDRR